jgi:hypothetical protein
MKLLIMESKEGRKVAYSHHVRCVSEVNDLHSIIVRRLSRPYCVSEFLQF